MYKLLLQCFMHFIGFLTRQYKGWLFIGGWCNQPRINTVNLDVIIWFIFLDSFKITSFEISSTGFRWLGRRWLWYKMHFFFTLTFTFFFTFRLMLLIRMIIGLLLLIWMTTCVPIKIWFCKNSIYTIDCRNEHATNANYRFVR